MGRGENWFSICRGGRLSKCREGSTCWRDFELPESVEIIATVGGKNGGFKNISDSNIFFLNSIRLVLWDYPIFVSRCSKHDVEYSIRVIFQERSLSVMMLAHPFLLIFVLIQIHQFGYRNLL